MKSPRPPEEVLRRVIRLSRLNGWSVALFAGVCALVSLALLDPIGVSVCLLVALGGALEVRGQRMLTRRNADGMRWLVRGQLVVLGVIWTYAATRLMSFDQEIVRELVSSDVRAALDEVGLTTEDVLPLARQFFYLLYGGLMAVTLIYQGGLALHYRRRTPAVEAALRAPPDVPAAAASPEDFAI